MKEHVCYHWSCDFFEKKEMQLFQSHPTSLKTTSGEYQGLEKEEKSTVSLHRGCSRPLMQLFKFDLFYL